VRTLETPWYVSAAAIAVGAAIGSYATGYARAATRYRSARRFTVAPQLRRGLAGLVLAARF
jgi:hypothetical protein